MTRKQALTEAINILSKHKEYSEIVELLDDIRVELPLIHWSDKSIRDRVEQFIIDNGKAPTTHDFKRAGMPPHPVIKNQYGITLGEWLRKNYPQPVKNFEQIKSEQNQAFINEYMRIKPKNQSEYNKERNKQNKSWMTIAKINGVSSWRALLGKLSLPIFASEENTRTTFKVNIYSDLP